MFIAVYCLWVYTEHQQSYISRDEHPLLHSLHKLHFICFPLINVLFGFVRQDNTSFCFVKTFRKIEPKTYKPCGPSWNSGHPLLNTQRGIGRLFLFMDYYYYCWTEQKMWTVMSSLDVPSSMIIDTESPRQTEHNTAVHDYAGDVIFMVMLNFLPLHFILVLI